MNLSVVGAVGLLLASLALGPTAYAGTSDIQCALGSNTISYDPSMTNTPA
ncbi:hypothetical protein [Streptomyces aidingensis]|nr:hypothetical protein [Streptomyces aidingensis]